MKLSLGPVACTALALAAMLAGCAAPNDEPAGKIDESTAAATETPLYTTWAKIARDRGVSLHREGRAAVVGVRGRSLDGSAHAISSKHAYDDMLVVLRRDGTAIELAASTHPFEKHGENGVPDVDEDGASDVGMIDPGVYVATGRGPERLVAGHAAFDVELASNGSGRLPGVRDTNHDGVFDEAERAASTSRRDGLTAVLFHHGDADAPPAVGCQVMADAAMRDFVRAVGGASATFDYVLVDSATL